MSEVPKFVRQRMEQWQGGEHPDGNLLSAFSEGTLTQAERARVLRHLSGCLTCREVVSLGLPDSAVSQPFVAPVTTSWMRWPMLRWAGVAAAVAVVAAAVLVHRSRPVAETAGAAGYSAPAAAKSQPAETAAAAPPPSHDLKTKGAAEKGTAAERSSGKKDVSEQAAVASRRAKAMPSSEPANTPRLMDSVAEQAAPAAPAMAANSALAGGAIAADKAKKQAEMAAAESGVSTAIVSGQAEDVAAAKSAPGRVVLNRNATGAMVQAPMMKTAIGTEPHWRISSQGGLERSTDAGQTWRLVRVGDTATMLRSFSAVGSDLWAGGSGGALYHSADKGRAWARVTVRAGDEVLQADIARVEFTDARRGAVTTVTGETWVTEDGGATWARR